MKWNVIDLKTLGLNWILNNDEKEFNFNPISIEILSDSEENKKDTVKEVVEHTLEFQEDLEVIVLDLEDRLGLESNKNIILRDDKSYAKSYLEIMYTTLLERMNDFRENEEGFSERHKQLVFVTLVDSSLLEIDNKHKAYLLKFLDISSKSGRYLKMSNLTIHYNQLGVPLLYGATQIDRL